MSSISQLYSAQACCAHMDEPIAIKEARLREKVKCDRHKWKSAKDVCVIWGHVRLIAILKLGASFCLYMNMPTYHELPC